MTVPAEYVLGVDLGTTNIKAMLVDRAGLVAGHASARFEYTRSPDDRCELPPNDFLATVRGVIGAACHGAGASPRQIRALSYGSQANTFLLLDRDDQPLTPLIVWNDRRAAPPDHDLRAFLESEDFLAHAGFQLPAPELAVAKLRWLHRHSPALMERARQFLSLSDFLVYTLSGERSGDQATASLLGLWSQHESRWWEAALAQAGCDATMFPRLVPPGAVAGPVSASGAEVMGLAAGTLLVAGTLDHHAAAWGAGVGSLADCSESTGTVIACLRIMPTRQTGSGYFIGPDLKPGSWYACAFSSNGASVLEDFRDRNAAGMSIQELIGLAASGSSDAMASGARSIMESISNELGALLRHLYGDQSPSAIVATGGGAASDYWLALKSRMLGVPFLRSNTTHPAAYGAAMMAAVGAGWFSRADEASKEWVRITRRFEP